ncbi:MAG: hypothetical protein KDJ45_09490 [Hyphomicrobiaceae bacterium]|nr:hypothetical protein [Hyphomicrobiaceae bacterium]MCC0009803.1 hypothetical protein [Hyphomicrobiaceae bacterium]
MALETVQTHPSIVVAGTAEVLRAGDLYRLSIVTFHLMTIDATVEIERRRTDALVYGLSPMVNEAFHMIATHPIGGHDALVATPLGRLRRFRHDGRNHYDTR